ncbi:TonB-dependent receptor domain-containing protein [Sorangium sp. So ce1389]|uniref:TonB-dependent receptor n=1 Tax=Sorangium sp. So ce1389 TaxID=3133336 RepID=UPI003F63C804
MRIIRAGSSALFALFVHLPHLASADESSALVGVVRDALTSAPLPDTRVEVVSTATGMSRTLMTDTTGEFVVAGLPPGLYVVRAKRGGFRPYSVPAFDLRARSTNRIDATLLPLELEGEEIVVEGRAPSVDVGSSATGVTIAPEFLQRVPLWRPNAKGAASRSFEALAEVAPGVNPDLFGFSISGASSPENQYLVDGFSIREPGQGFIGTPLSAHFLREVNVVTGGFSPEYGRVTGGVISAVTKSGTNELRGSVFSSITPGVLEGVRRPVRREGQTIHTDIALTSVRDIGLDIGGPIVEDRLWYYAGGAVSLTRFDMDRYLNRQVWEGNQPQKDDQGFTKVTKIEGTNRRYYADQSVAQAISKLTYQPSESWRAQLVAFGSYVSAGGDGRFAVRPQTGAVEVSNIAGTFGALASKVRASSFNLAGSLAAAFMDRHLLLDVQVAGARYHTATLPSDGLGIGKGLARLPHVIDQRTSPAPHSITEYNEIDVARCPLIDVVNDAGEVVRQPTCPVSEYRRGGTQGIDISTLDRYHARAELTWLTKALGHHVVKAGIDAEITKFDHFIAHPGGVSYRENGQTYKATRYGYLAGPDQPVFLPSLEMTSRSTAVGGFVQDSWSMVPGLVLNLGVRYDSQLLSGSGDRLAIALHHAWAPRVGAVYDFTRAGRSKVFGSFARYFESIPLYLPDRSFPGDRVLRTFLSTNDCTPLSADPEERICAADPDARWAVSGDAPPQVDPSLQPQSLDELILGVEYEVFPGGRVALQYTRRWMNQVIDDMSRDETRTYFIGNPGAGIAGDLPAATRDYDALTLMATKSFSRGWLVHASYTLSSLRGNYSGLFQPETSQFQPNRNSDFDLLRLTVNRTGPLMGDHRHQLQLYGAKDFEVAPNVRLSAGLAMRARSGGPVNYLGADPIYGNNEVFVLPRGSGGRLPWVASVDPRLGASLRFTKATELSLSVDVFNVFNAQAETARDNTYTRSSVRPIEEGRVEDLAALMDTEGNPVGKNPNFNKPSAYQTPLQVRIAASLTF